MDESGIIKKLKELLENSVKSSCENEKQVGIVFSAGLDSGVIAFLAQKFSDVRAYTVGNENSEDVQIAEKLKSLVDFDIRILEIGTDAVGKILPKILKIIEKKDDPLQVSCAVPVYIAAKEVKKDNLRVILSGQGGDELFGGYNRYLQHVSNYGKLEKIMKKDAENAYGDNLNRDIAMCKAHEIELRFPFMNDRLVNFALKIPAELKIKEVNNKEFSCIDILNGKNFVRKYILRKVAEKVGVPDIIINRKKKALQYGSQSMKMLEKIAREEGFKSNVRAYLETLAENP